MSKAIWKLAGTLLMGVILAIGAAKEIEPKHALSKLFETLALATMIFIASVVEITLLGDGAAAQLVFLTVLIFVCSGIYLADFYPTLQPKKTRTYDQLCFEIQRVLLTSYVTYGYLEVNQGARIAGYLAQLLGEPEDRVDVALKRMHKAKLIESKIVYERGVRQCKAYCLSQPLRQWVKAKHELQPLRYVS